MSEHIIGEGPTNGELMVLIQSNDLRYQQRFETQETNLITAITAQEKAVAAALQAAKEAVTKAEIAAEKRFDAQNEFRAQLSDQANTFMPRGEADLQLRSLDEKINTLQGIVGSIGSRSQGQIAGQSTAIAFFVAAFSMVAVVATIVIAVITH